MAQIKITAGAEMETFGFERFEGNEYVYYFFIFTA
jgi:hypothetical protein